VDDRYPYRVLSFRTNSGDRTDTLALENARRARDMLDRGRLDAVLPYYFYWPGQANCDLHRELLEQAGLWGHSRLVSVIDVEGAPADGVKRVRGDQSGEVNEEAERLAGWYSDRRRIVGYFNAVADPELWRTRPAGMRFITPSYSGMPGVWADDAPPAWMQRDAFAQQYTQTGRCAPWTGDVDLNYTDLELPALLGLLGIQGGKTMADTQDPVVTGAAQLHPFPDKIRQITHPEFVNTSTRSPAEPWTYDMWADIWNETVWDGFELPADHDDDPKSLVGWVLDIAASNRAILSYLGAIDAKLTHLLGGQ
jgi:hypothetical protein